MEGLGGGNVSASISRFPGSQGSTYKQLGIASHRKQVIFSQVVEVNRVEIIVAMLGYMSKAKSNGPI
jgi:hypothetical protein